MGKSNLQHQLLDLAIKVARGATTRALLDSKTATLQLTTRLLMCIKPQPIWLTSKRSARAVEEVSRSNTE